MRVKNIRLRLNIAIIHICIILFCSIINVVNAHKSRHTVSRFRLVKYYNRNNIRNLFSGNLLTNATIIPYIFYKYYNKILDYIFLIGELILFTIHTLRTF